MWLLILLIPAAATAAIGQLIPRQPKIWKLGDRAILRFYFH